MAVYGQTIPQNRVRRYRQNLTGYRQKLRIPTGHGGFNKGQSIGFTRRRLTMRVLLPISSILLQRI